MTADEVAQMEAKAGGGEMNGDLTEYHQNGAPNGSAKRKAGRDVKSGTPNKKSKHDDGDDEDEDDEDDEG